MNKLEKVMQQPKSVRRAKYKHYRFQQEVTKDPQQGLKSRLSCLKPPQTLKNQCDLPSNPETNPKDQFNTILLKNGKEIEVMEPPKLGHGN